MPSRLADGLLSEADLDRAVARILRVKIELGLFENPRAPSQERIEAVIGAPEHADLNLRAARASLVLLANDGVLPLLPPTSVDDDGRALASGPARRIAVVGPLADAAQTQLGDWAGSSGQVDWMPDGHPREQIETVLDGLRRLTPSGWEVEHEHGARILDVIEDPAGATFPDGQPRPPVAAPAAPDPAAIERARALAEAADVVIAVVGDQIEVVGEGRSTATLELLGGQVALLDAVTATTTPVVVVLLASKPHVLPEAVKRAGALIWAGNPGMRGGRAIAELVLGLVEPRGRLPISFPVHVGQQPTYYNQIRGQHGDRYADLTQRPAHAFGEGLGYSTITYAGVAVARDTVEPGEVVRASVTVTNTGERAAHEVVQAYVRDRVTSASWADLELKAFAHVDLAPGESRRVEVEIPVADCTIVDAEGRRVVEPGEFDVLLGPSSRPEQLQAAPFVVLDPTAGP